MDPISPPEPRSCHSPNTYNRSDVSAFWWRLCNERAPPRFFAAPHRSRSKNLVGSVLVKQSDLCTRLRKIGTEGNVAPVLLLSNGFSGLPKNCNDGALIDRCDVRHAPKTKTTLNVVQPKCALPDRCDHFTDCLRFIKIIGLKTRPSGRLWFVVTGRRV